ncbi:MAG TPA: hypothetical protein VJP78_09065 [Thermoleophilia bacterium]|nr:hypothetical protein [Thermoleophilia bacterium]
MRHRLGLLTVATAAAVTVSLAAIIGLAIQIKGLEAEIASMRNALADPLVQPLPTAAPDQIVPVDFLWTEFHDQALEIYYSYPRRIVGIFEMVGEGVTSIEDINARIVPHDRDWTLQLAEVLEGDGLIRSLYGFPIRFGPTSHGRRVYAALSQIPKWLKDQAECHNFNYPVCESLPGYAEYERMGLSSPTPPATPEAP